MKYARVKYKNEIYYAEIKENTAYLLDGDIFDLYSQSGIEVSIDKVKLLAPCEPSKIIAVGLNYKSHADELDLNIPSFPALFMKPTSSVIAHDENITYPPMSNQVDYEAELAIVIGKTASYVSEDKAKDYIFGYTCLNDVTARDLQRQDSQWTRAKGFDTFAPIGPWIETDLDPDNLDISLKLNGETRQSSNTKHFIFDTKYLVSKISEIMTLYPGDIITTGTPQGIGAMKSGDTVEITIEGIGTLKNTVLKKGENTND